MKRDIIDSSGNEVTDPKRILREQFNFYSKLYSIDEDVQFNFTTPCPVRIPEDIAQRQKQPFSEDEVKQAIKMLKPGKTPSHDGLSAEFYQVFYSRIADILYPAINYMYEQRRIVCSMSMGILNLIPKEKRDTRYLKNLRPITLLTTDYKIIEKMIANRMEEFISIIINNDQKGFVKDRRISVNIRKIFDLMKFAEKENLDCIVLSLNFEKCFDKISHTAIEGALKYFGASQFLIDWINILYQDFTVKIQNNGFFSQRLRIQKGVHQGGPASSLIFLCVAELLAIDLRSCDKIKGIPVMDIQNLLGQFADDMDIYMMFDQQSMSSVIDILENFRACSGFTVNYDKTNIYRIGSLRNSHATLYTQKPLKWTNEDINVLGIHICANDMEAITKNYEPIFKKIEVILKTWSNRSLSLHGKVNIINTLIGSLFVYKMMVLPEIPRNMISNFNAICDKYIWNGRKLKIPNEILRNNVENGGCKLVDLEIKDQLLKTIWVNIIQTDSQVANLAYQALFPDLGSLLWRCNLEPKDVNTVTSELNNCFWTHMLKAWAIYQTSVENLHRSDQILWLNSKI